MGWSTERNNPCEVKGEDKDTLHHSQTHTAQFQLFFSLKGKTDQSDIMSSGYSVDMLPSIVLELPLNSAPHFSGLKWAGLNGKT